MNENTIPSPRTITPGWRTSEGQMTAAAAGLYTLGTLAETFGYLPPGSTAKLAPAVMLVGGYLLSRSGLKAVATKAVQALPTQAPTTINTAPGLDPKLIAEQVAKAVQEVLQGQDPRR